MQFKTKLGLVDIPNEEVLRAADVIRAESRIIPWQREREGRMADAFLHSQTGTLVTVESQADGNVYWRSETDGKATDCQNTIEEWHRLVTKAMESGHVTFTPGPF